MSQPILSLGMWISLPNEVRYRIRALFNIPKSKATEVDDGRVVSDGTTYDDLKVLTMEVMQEYIGDKDDNFYRLFDRVVAKVNDELYPPKISPVTVLPDNKPMTIIIEPKKRAQKYGKKK